MIVSIHIPKTAGGSFSKGLSQRFGDRLLLDYGDKPLSDSMSDRWLRLRSRAEVRFRADELARSYDAVHGHFIATKYLPLGDHNSYLCAFFRNPVERVISHYHYWQRISWAGNTMWEKMHRRNLSPGQVASLPRQRKLYHLFTAGLPMARFAFIGVTEEYRTSLALFKAIFGIDIRYHHVNTSENAKCDLDPRELGDMKTTQQENFKIYDAARHRFDTLCNQYLVRP